MSRPTSQATSAAPKRATGQYRTVSKTCDVDEMLFGSQSKTRVLKPSDTNIDSSTKHLPSKQLPTQGRRASEPAKATKEVLEIVTKDGIRKLNVPDRNAAPESIVLSRSDFERIKSSAVVRSRSAEDRARKALRQQQQEEAEKSAARRQDMAQKETRRQQNEPKSEADIERATRDEEVRRQAERMMEEDEDDIRKLNEMILQAKCYAIRDSQLREKADIATELASENHRLDEMMESERVRALKEFEEREERLTRERQRGAMEIRKQIEEREEQRLIEDELRDQETQALLRQMRELQELEKAEAKRKIEHGRKVIMEAAKVNERSLQLKREKAELERLEDRRAADYLKEKQARLDQLEKEKEEQKKERELEIARLRALQEQAQDKMAERHALEAKRQQDEIERQWRRKEMESLKRQEQIQAELQCAREEQVRMKEHFIALQTKQERQDFQRVLDAQKELIRSEEEKLRREQEKRQLHIEHVQTQIKEKEREKIDERKAFFEEGVRLDKEAQTRRMKLDEIKQRKLEELRACGVDDKYMGPIIRMVSNQKQQPK